MTLLAIDCSTQVCSVALSTEQGIFLRQELLPQSHAKKILFFVDALFTESQSTASNLTAIAVGIGPGSFTGLRIAAAVAQGLAFGLNLPLLPVSSLQILAQTAHQVYQEPWVLVAMDARMGEVYWGEYQFDGASKIMLTKQADQLTKPQDCHSLQSPLQFAVGSALQAYHLPLQPLKRDITLLPQADALIKIAIENLSKKRMIPPDKLQLNYLRNEVVHKS